MEGLLIPISTFLMIQVMAECLGTGLVGEAFLISWKSTMPEPCFGSVSLKAGKWLEAIWGGER